MKSTLSRPLYPFPLFFLLSFFFVFEHMTNRSSFCTITMLFLLFFPRFYLLLTNLALLARFMVCRAYHAYNIGYCNSIIYMYIYILYNVDIYVNDISMCVCVVFLR